MDYDRLQEAWQSQKNELGVGVDTERLLVQVRERHRKFVRAVFWRDVREVDACVVSAAFFSWCATREFGGWLFYVAAALTLSVGLFFIGDRYLQRRKQRAFGDTVKDGIARALHQVNHQIWLLENVLWWYLLPGAIAITLILTHVVVVLSTQRPVPLARAVITVGSTVCLCVATLCFVYFLNRRAVRKELLPRREQLAQLTDIARELREGE